MPDPSDRLSALRAVLARAGVQAFLVPRADRHQNEYVAPADERLAFISGFTGTAGVAAIGLKDAALFTDGRYTIQARRQLDLTRWDLRSIQDDPPVDWLAQVLTKGDRVGYDPALHRVRDIEAMQTRLTRDGIDLTPLADNPVDAIWATRPAPPMGQAVPYPLEFAGTPATRKIAAISGEIGAQDCAGLLISAPENLCWLFNVRGSDVSMTPLVMGFALLGSDGSATVFVDPAKRSDSFDRALAEAGVRIADPDALAGALGAFTGRKLRLDATTASVALADMARAAGATPDIGTDPVFAAKARKTAHEIAGLRAAHLRDGAAVSRFLAWLARAAPGTLSEWDAAEALLSYRTPLNRFMGLSFSTISAAAGNAAEAHYQLTRDSAAPLNDGDIYLVDSGAQYLDGTTDITRTTVIGTPTPEMRRRYTQVLKGHIALGNQRFPKGVTGAGLDPLARQFLWADGADYAHGTGHGVGSYLGVHEGPHSISPRGTGVAIEPGMVVSIEPGYYKAGHFGIRIENLVVVREMPDPPPLADGPVLEFETLTRAPYERRLIDTAMLTPDEIAWIDAYHARVAADIGPQLDGADANWLAAATAPLAG